MKCSYKRKNFEQKDVKIVPKIKMTAKKIMIIIKSIRRVQPVWLAISTRAYSHFYFFFFVYFLKLFRSAILFNSNSLLKYIFIIFIYFFHKKFNRYEFFFFWICVFCFLWFQVFYNSKNDPKYLLKMQHKNPKLPFNATLNQRKNKQRTIKTKWRLKSLWRVCLGVWRLSWQLNACYNVGRC